VYASTHGTAKMAASTRISATVIGSISVSSFVGVFFHYNPCKGCEKAKTFGPC
jgi:hypothetical protein